MAARTPIEGIPVDIANPEVRRGIRTVLTTISRFPRDWGRIRRRVREIRYFAPEDDQPDTLGQWVVDEEELRRLSHQQSAPGTWGRPAGQIPAYGRIMLTRRPIRHTEHLVAIVAHECGHAATRERDFQKRDGYSGEWASELCADFYAFKWGFEAELRKAFTRRPLNHYCGFPGETLEVGHGDDVQRFRVDKRFYLRELR